MGLSHLKWIPSALSVFARGSTVQTIAQCNSSRKFCWAIDLVGIQKLWMFALHRVGLPGTPCVRSTPYRQLSYVRDLARGASVLHSDAQTAQRCLQSNGGAAAAELGDRRMMRVLPRLRSGWFGSAEDESTRVANFSYSCRH